MPWETKIVEKPNKYVEIIYSGTVSPEELYMALEKCVLLSKENNTKLFLADLTTMIGGHSVMDLYGLIALFEALKIERDIKEAVIMGPLQDSAEEIRFYETACKNRGFNVRIFAEKNKALAWLTS